MLHVFRLSLLLGVLSVATCEVALGQSASIVSIATPRGVQQPFILIKPAHPIASVILFAGGNGVLRLDRVTPLTIGDVVAGNFLVRSRKLFVAHDFMVAVIDVPSDQQQGMSGAFRISQDHAVNIGAVADYMKSQASVPVWLVGTSAGTWSAARGAIGAGRDGIATGSIDGLVLTSTVTRIPPWLKESPESVMSMPLPEIRVPTLIVSHRDDACAGTPAADAPALAGRLTQASKVEIALLDGGLKPLSGPCDAYAQHGYLGIETETVDRIAQFITANKRPP